MVVSHPERLTPLQPTFFLTGGPALVVSSRSKKRADRGREARS
jgi:hypothetical protein